MSRYYFSWLLLCVGLLYECSIYSVNDLDVAPAAQSDCECVPRKRSPLGIQSFACDEDDALQGIRYLFQSVQPEQRVLLQVPVYNPITLRHKQHGYEISMHLGNIAQYDGTAVINTYTPGRQMPAACLDLYKKAGSSFVQGVRNIYIAHPALFKALESLPGNSCVIPEVGGLAYDLMVLLYMPQVVASKQRTQVAALITEGVTTILSKKLYDIFQTYDVDNASVVIPALGHDTFFEGYDRSEMARNLVSTAVVSLRYLHGMKKNRLQAISFVVDTPEAYQYYAEALNVVRETEKEYFDCVEE